MTNPNLKIDNAPDGLHMTIEGEVNLQNAHVFQQFLVESTERSGDEILNFTNQETLDVTAMQLAIVWKHSLKQQGRKAKVLLPVSFGQADLFEKSGITKILL